MIKVIILFRKKKKICSALKLKYLRIDFSGFELVDAMALCMGLIERDKAADVLNLGQIRPPIYPLASFKWTCLMVTCLSIGQERTRNG
jgi:hypothetical protein